MRLLLFALREQDLNLRPSGYEPDELPDCSIPRQRILLYDISLKMSNFFLEFLPFNICILYFMQKHAILFLRFRRLYNLYFGVPGPYTLQQCRRKFLEISSRRGSPRQQIYLLLTLFLQKLCRVIARITVWSGRAMR